MTITVPESCASHKDSPVCAADAIQECLDAARQGNVLVFPKNHWDSCYRISRPLIVTHECEVRGESTPHVQIKAMPNFVGDAMVKSRTWDNGDWAHHMNFSNFLLHGANVAPVGLAIYQCGEESIISRVVTNHCTHTGIWLTGAHAPANLQLCRANDCPVGLRIGKHPTRDGNSGIVNINAFSGDDNPVHVRIEGSQNVILNALKSERSNVAVQFGPAADGTLFLTGGANGEAGEAFLDVQGGSPSITAIGCMINGYRWALRNANPSRSLPGTARIDLLTTGQHWSEGGTILGVQTPLYGRDPFDGSIVKRLIHWMSDNVTRFIGPGTTAALCGKDNKPMVQVKSGELGLYGKYPVPKPALDDPEWKTKIGL